MFVWVELSSCFYEQVLLTVPGPPAEVAVQVDREAALVKPSFVDTEQVLGEQFSLFPASD